MSTKDRKKKSCALSKLADEGISAIAAKLGSKKKKRQHDRALSRGNGSRTGGGLAGIAAEAAMESRGSGAPGMLKRMMTKPRVFDELKDDSEGKKIFTFCHYYGKRGETYRSIGSFTQYLQDKESRMDVQSYWQDFAKTTASTEDRIQGFLYACLQGYLRHLTITDWDTTYGGYELLPEGDPHWLYYVSIMSRLLNHTLHSSFPDLMAHINREFPKWVDNAEILHHELTEIMLDHTRGEDFIQFVDKHADEIDVNCIWSDLIILPQKPNLDAFRCLLYRYFPVLKIVNCNTDRISTPMSLARSYNVTPLIACVDAYLRNLGSAEWGESPAMKLARRVSEDQAVARATIERLKMKRGERALNTVMQALSDVLISQINDQMAYSSDLLTLVHTWQADSKKNEALMMVVKKKSRAVLDSTAITKDVLAWNFAKRILVSSDTCVPMFICSPDYRETVAELYSYQMKKKEDLLARNLRKVVMMDPEAYVELCNVDGTFEHFTSTNPKIKFRQDTWFKDDKHPINQPNVTAKDLEHVSLRSTSPDFDAKVTYDFNSYLSKLLLNAHIIDPAFRREIYRVQELIPELAIGKVQFGPVKGAERCKAKAADAKRAKWPKTATLLDLIRCSFTFDRVSHMTAAIKAFRDRVSPDRWRRKKMEALQARRKKIRKRMREHLGVTEDELKEASMELSEDGSMAINVETEDEQLLLSDMFETVRCKNGFYRKFNPRADPPEVPTRYCDYKLNICVRAKVNHRHFGIIGEVQFLLQPMLDHKKTGHQLYEVSRNDEGLFSDARTAFSRHFTHPFSVLQNAANSSSMASFFMHFSDHPDFQTPSVLERLLQILALGAEYKRSLFDRARVMYEQLITADPKVKRPKFNEDFMCKFISQRSSQKDLDRWLKTIIDLIGKDRFKQQLFYVDPSNGFCPLMSYLNNLKDKDLFKDTIADELIPAMMTDEQSDQFWFDYCYDNFDRNIIRLAADQCVKGYLIPSMIFPYLKTVLGTEVYDQLLCRKGESGRNALLGLLMDLPKNADLTEDILRYLIPTFTPDPEDALSPPIEYSVSQTVEFSVSKSESLFTPKVGPVHRRSVVGQMMAARFRKMSSAAAGDEDGSEEPSASMPPSMDLMTGGPSVAESMEEEDGTGILDAGDDDDGWGETDAAWDEVEDADGDGDADGTTADDAGEIVKTQTSAVDSLMDWQDPDKEFEEHDQEMDDWTEVTAKRFWTEITVDDAGKTIAHAVAFSAAKRGFVCEDVLFKVVSLCGEYFFQRMLKQKHDIWGKPCDPPVIHYLQNCESVGFNIDMFKCLVPEGVNDSFWQDRCVVGAGKRNIVHVYCTTAAQKNFSPASGLEQLREYLGSKLFDSLLKKRSMNEDKTPLMEYILEYKNTYVFSEKTFRMLIPTKILESAPKFDPSMVENNDLPRVLSRMVSSEPSTEMVTLDSTQSFWIDDVNIAVCIAKTAAKNSFSPLPALIFLFKACGLEVYNSLMRRCDSFGMTPLAAYLELCTLKDLSSLKSKKGRKKKVRFDGSGSSEDDSSSESDDEELVKTKTMVEEAMPDYVDRKKVDEMISRDFDSSKVLYKLLPSDLGPVPTGPMKKKSESESSVDETTKLTTEESEWDPYFSKSCVSHIHGTLAHIAALKYGFDGIRNFSLIDELRRIFGDYLWDRWLLTRHQFEEKKLWNPAMWYLNNCLSESSFSGSVFEEFLPKQFRSGLRDSGMVLLSSDEVKMDDSSGAAAGAATGLCGESLTSSQASSATESSLLTAESYWFEHCVNTERKNILHIIASISAEKQFSPVRRLAIIRSCVGDSIYCELQSRSDMYDKTPLMQYLFQCRSSSSLTVSALKMLIPPDMTEAEKEKYFTKTCVVSYNGNNLLIVLAGICAQNSIPIRPLLEGCKEMLGAKLYRRLLQAKNKERQNACLNYLDQFQVSGDVQSAGQSMINAIDSILPSSDDVAKGLDLNDVSALIPEGMLPNEISEFIHECMSVKNAQNLGFLRKVRQKVGEKMFNHVLRTGLDWNGRNCLMHYLNGIVIKNEDLNLGLLEAYIPKGMTPEQKKEFWMKLDNEEKSVYGLVMKTPKGDDILNELMLRVNDEELWKEMKEQADPTVYYEEPVGLEGLESREQFFIQVLGFGFTDEQAHEAWEVCDGNVDMAVTYLFDAYQS